MQNLIEKKVKPPKNCQDGKHTFIVTGWNTRPSQRTATKLTCQHCLTTADKAEQEVVSQIRNDKAKEITEPAQHSAECF